MTEISAAIAEYQSALEENFKLTQREVVIKAQRIKAQHRLSMARDELRAIELDTLQNLNVKSI